MDDTRYLAGCPSKKVVRDVKRHLNHLGIRPVRSALWVETWAWASKIRTSYFHPRWPLVSEIAGMYVYLLLMDMNSVGWMRLPFRAAEQMPETVKLRLPAPPQPRQPLLDWKGEDS